MVSRMPSADDTPQLAYRWSGPVSSPFAPIVLLHGLGDSGDCWPDAVRRWSGDHLVVGVDALGHGRSPRFTPSQLAAADPMEEMYAAVLTVVSSVAAQSGPVTLVGHSMGGGLAAAIAARRPDLVRAAVLEEPAWRDQVHRVQPEHVVAERIADCRRFRDDPEGALADGTAEHRNWPDVELEPWARSKAQVDLGFLELGVASLDVPWEDLVRAIAAPTLVVVGAESDLISPAIRERAAAVANPRVQLEVVAGAGHTVRRDRPEDFHALVDPWVAVPA